MAKKLDGPSTNLTWAELACKDGTPYPEIYIRDARAARLAFMFEKIRFLWNQPIKIHSAYRTPSYNKKIGGAQYSQHIQGRALDLAPPEHISLNVFYNIIKENADFLGIHGLGKYLTFVHVDIRPTNKLALWRGNGVKDSGTNV